MPSYRLPAAGCLLLAAALTACGSSGGSSSNGSTSASTAPSASSSPSAAASPTASGEPFSSQQYHFSAVFPETPKQVPVSQSVGSVTVTGRVFSVGTDADGTSLAVLQFPASAQVNAEKAVEGAINGGATSAGGSVTSRRSETFQGHPAQIATIKAEGTTITIEAFVADKRLYGLIGAPQTAFDQLRSSFKLTP